MAIFLLFLTITVFLTTFTICAYFFLKSGRGKNSLNTLVNGIKTGILGSGLFSPTPKNEVKVYKWVPMHNGCEEAQERAQWEPMDIIDWMEAGLPQTPEMEEQCDENCRCQLVETRRRSEKQSQN